MPSYEVAIIIPLRRTATSLELTVVSSRGKNFISPPLFGGVFALLTGSSVSAPATPPRPEPPAPDRSDEDGGRQIEEVDDDVDELYDQAVQERLGLTSRPSSPALEDIPEEHCAMEAKSPRTSDTGGVLQALLATSQHVI